MSAPNLEKGAIFAGRYRIVRHIAAGGMGNVYEVTHCETDNRLALKVMHPHVLTSQRMRDRFRQEAKISSKIQSESIVQIFDAGIDQAADTPFIVMELLQGEELKKRVRDAGRLGFDETIKLFQQLAAVLKKTHEANIVHRDLTPDNIFLTEREDGSLRIKVLDFGIAKIIADDGPNTTHETMGTPLYMAPEQFRSGVQVTSAADIYALGLIAYLMLVGCPYWKDEIDAGMNVIAFASVAMRGPEERATARARRRGVRLPAAFDAWFATATALSAAQRFPSVTVAVEELGRALTIRVPPRQSDSKLQKDPRFMTTVRVARPPMPASRPSFGARRARHESAPSYPTLDADSPTSSPAPSTNSPTEHASDTLSTATTMVMHQWGRRSRMSGAAGLTGLALLLGVVVFLIMYGLIGASNAGSVEPASAPPETAAPQSQMLPAPQPLHTAAAPTPPSAAPSPPIPSATAMSTTPDAPAPKAMVKETHTSPIARSGAAPAKTSTAAPESKPPTGSTPRELVVFTFRR